MNSRNIFHIPPVNQWYFSNLPGHFLAVCYCYSSFEISTFFILKRLMIRYRIPVIAFVLVKPLVVLELTGNLHGEGVLLFFLSGLWSLSKLQDFKGGVLLGFFLSYLVLCFCLIVGELIVVVKCFLELFCFNFCICSFY